MSQTPKSLRAELNKLTQLQSKLQARGTPAMSAEALRDAIEAEDKKRFAALAKARTVAQQQHLRSLVASSDVNPKWTLVEAERLHRLSPQAYDFTNGYETLTMLCMHLLHHHEVGGVCWMLLGAFGRGKSTLAGAMYHAYIEQGQSACMIQWQKLVRHVWAGGLKAQVLLDNVYTTDLLVIDELGYDGQPLRETEQMLLSTIIRNRKSNCRSIVICSNHYPNSFEKAIGDPSVQGLRDYKAYTSVFEGASYREPLFTDIHGHSMADRGAT